MQSQTHPTEDLGGNPPQKTATIGRAKDKGGQNGQAKNEAGGAHQKTETRCRSPKTDSRLQSEHFSSELYRSKSLQELVEQGRIRLEGHLPQNSAAEVSLGVQGEILTYLSRFLGTLEPAADSKLPWLVSRVDSDRAIIVKLQPSPSVIA